MQIKEKAQSFQYKIIYEACNPCNNTTKLSLAFKQPSTNDTYYVLPQKGSGAKIPLVLQKRTDQDCTSVAVFEPVPVHC